jgi:hypothetical protein
MTAIHGAHLLDRLSSFLRPCQLTTAAKLDNKVSEDMLEKAAKSKSPSRKKEISRINGADIDLEKFISNLCAEAGDVILPLSLKAFSLPSQNIGITFFPVLARRYGTYSRKGP